jgi:serine 3-dehydrogenase
MRADQTPPLVPTDIAKAVCFMLEQPEHADVARMLLVSTSEPV